MTICTSTTLKSGVIVVVVLAASMIGSAPAEGANASVGDLTPSNVVYTLPKDPTANHTTAQQNLSVTRDGWIHYPSLLTKAGLASAKSTTGKAKGTRVGGVCQISYSGTWTTAQGEVFIEETAFRPKTCESRIRITRVTRGQAGKISIASHGSLGNVGTTSSVGKKFTPTATLTNYLGHNKTLWIDPINITIASQAANLKWKSNKTFVSERANRYGFVGKILGLAVDTTRVTSSSTSRSGVAFTAKATFKNTDFSTWVTRLLGPAGWAACGFPETPLATFNFKNKITGTAGAKFTYSLSDSKSGACTNLVHHGQNVGAGWVS